MQSRDRSVLTLIYVRKPAERQVLLGLKKRGFGVGKFNGFGGKLELGEALEESAARELHEESGLQVDVPALRWCGSMTYIYETRPKAMWVHIYDVDQWEGEPQETEEMKPSWFSHESIPLQDMWPDDDYWLLQYLSGQLATPFLGRFRFKGHEGPDSRIVLEQAVSSLAVPRGPEAGPPAGAALLASTVCFSTAPGGSAQPLESFLHYHVAKGFAHIMLFMDDAADTAVLSAARKFPRARVSVRVRGEPLRDEQRRRCVSFDELAPLLEAEVSARQMLDAELAMALAPELGCSWVVCLDSDELFFTREGSVAPHFAALAADGVDQMTYLNHEGVPETEDTPDYFATTTLFKRHHFAVPLSQGAREGLRFWMGRSQRRQYLLFYDNGKSACRAGLGGKPWSQHLWRLPGGCRSCTAMADPRRMDVGGYRSCDDPCVLHFPVCGFAWLLSKYRRLGDFPDAWLGGKVRLPDSFHSDAREACAAGEEALRGLFRREVMLDDPHETARQVSCGTCMRIEHHAELLGSIPVAGPPRAEAPSKPPPTSEPALPPLGAGVQGIENGWILSKMMGYL